MSRCVLAHPVRLRILALTSRGPLGAGEVARTCKLSRATVESHLETMRRAGALDLVPVARERGPAVRGYVPSGGLISMAMALRALIDTECAHAQVKGPRR